jgi:hypothetical protein
MTSGTATYKADRTTVSGSTGVPWYLWCAALAVTSAYVGGYWDISWHRSIGRDSFWSAPHMAIYACGVLAGISSAYLIFSTTFRQQASLRDVSVRIWGLSARSSVPGAASRCWRPRRSTTGGTTRTAST